MKRVLNSLGALLFLVLGLFYAWSWLRGGTPDNTQQDASHYASFIAGALCLSLGSVFAWRATRKDVNDTNDDEDAAGTTSDTKPAGTLDSKSPTQTTKDSQS